MRLDGKETDERRRRHFTDLQKGVQRMRCGTQACPAQETAGVEGDG